MENIVEQYRKYSIKNKIKQAQTVQANSQDPPSIYPPFNQYFLNSLSQAISHENHLLRNIHHQLARTRSEKQNHTIKNSSCFAHKLFKPRLKTIASRPSKASQKNKFKENQKKITKETTFVQKTTTCCLPCSHDIVNSCQSYSNISSSFTRAPLSRAPTATPFNRTSTPLCQSGTTAFQTPVNERGLQKKGKNGIQKRLNRICSGGIKRMNERDFMVVGAQPSWSQFECYHVIHNQNTENN